MVEFYATLHTPFFFLLELTLEVSCFEKKFDLFERLLSSKINAFCVN